MDTVTIGNKEYVQPEYDFYHWKKWFKADQEEEAWAYYDALRAIPRCHFRIERITSWDLFTESWAPEPEFVISCWAAPEVMGEEFKLPLMVYRSAKYVQAVGAK